MNKKMKKVINGTLVGTMIFSMIGVAFADNQLDSVNKTKITKTKFGIEKRQDKFKSILDQIVEKEILTQEQADNILEKIAEEKGERERLTLEELKLKLEEKVANGEITQEKANELIKRMASKGDAEKLSKGRKEVGNKGFRERLTLEERKAKLEEKVANGEITQDKANEILEKMENKKMKNEKMDRIERLKAVFSEFVEDGIITQNQLDEILELFE